MKNRCFCFLGYPGSGKSTWIHNNNLEYMTCSLDKICDCLPKHIGKDFKLHYKNNETIRVSIFNDWLNSNVDFIFDAPIYTKQLFNRYVNVVKQYCYDVYFIDFSKDFTIEQLKRNNKNRIKPYNEMENFDFQISKSCIDHLKQCIEEDYQLHLISKEEAINMIFDYSAEYVDLSNYEDVVVVGNHKSKICPKNLNSVNFYIIFDDIDFAQAESDNVVMVIGNNFIRNKNKMNHVYHTNCHKYFKYIYNNKKYIVSYNELFEIPCISYGYSCLNEISSINDPDVIFEKFESNTLDEILICTNRKNIFSNKCFNRVKNLSIDCLQIENEYKIYSTINDNILTVKASRI